MARVHWIIDPEHPDGHEVPYTAEEEAQADLDAAAGVVNAVREETERGNETTLRDRVEQVVTELEQRQAAWATLTAAQKDATLRLTVRVVAALARIVLRKLDSA